MRPGASLVAMVTLCLAMGAGAGAGGPPHAARETRPRSHLRARAWRASTTLMTKRESADSQADKIFYQQEIYTIPWHYPKRNVLPEDRLEKIFTSEDENETFVKRKNMRTKRQLDKRPKAIFSRSTRILVLVGEFTMAVLVAMLPLWYLKRLQRARTALTRPPRGPRGVWARPLLIRASLRSLLLRRDALAAYVAAEYPSHPVDAPSERWDRWRSATSQGERGSWIMLMAALRAAERSATAAERAARAARLAALRTAPSHELTAAGVRIADKLEVERAIAGRRLSRLAARDSHTSDAFDYMPRPTRGITKEAEPTEALLAAFGERQPPVRRHSAIGLVRHDAPPPALSRRGASDLAPSVSLPDLRVLGELRAALAPPPPRPAHADADVERVDRI